MAGHTLRGSRETGGLQRCQALKSCKLGVTSHSPLRHFYVNIMHVLNLACPPIPIVRIGLIGLGNRGFATLQRYIVLDDIQITALCDLNQQNVERATQFLSEQHNHLASSVKCPSPKSYRHWTEVCHAGDVDLVIICTDWQSHTPIAVEAMNSAKHVAIEVPAAMTVADCWTLVDTAERTQRHCFMLENCCYDPFALMTRGMAEEGILGDITHCEGAYIHDLRQQFNADEAHGGYHKRWMSKYTEQHTGNPYPTHGLGPICQLLDIHRGDRMTHLVSLSSDIRYEQRGHDIAENHINNTLIRTALGRSILIQYDVTTPRPYNRLQTVCGTRGFSQKYPVPTVQLDEDATALFTGDEAIRPLMERFIPAHIRQIMSHGEAIGVPNIMNHIMDVRLISALRQGLPLDIDVYDAAEWSCITQLTQLSASNGSVPVPIPDFTRGHWR